jgi:signal peptidase I
VGQGDESGVVERLVEEESDGARLGGVRDWARSVLVAAILFLIVRAFGIEAFRIPTSSMENTLLVGDFLLVNKAIYGAPIPGTDLRLPALSEPRRNEVVVFRPPHDPEKNYVKRLVGLPGDTLEMRGKKLFLNGTPVHEPRARFVDGQGDAAHPGMRWQSNHLIAGPVPRYHPTRDNWGPIVVPPRHYFVLGDNRDNSEDSRYWGFVPRDAIQGRPAFVYYSFDPQGVDGLAWLRHVRWKRIGTRIR